MSADLHDTTPATPLTVEILAESSVNLAEAKRLTSDPIDALRLTSDLYALNAYRAECALTALARVPAPPPPKPISNAMRHLQSTLKAQLSAIIELLAPDERALLVQRAPSVADRLDLGDPDIIEDLGRLVTMPPADAVAWIRARLNAHELAR